jgi:hypothetical protein
MIGYCWNMAVASSRYRLSAISFCWSVWWLVACFYLLTPSVAGWMMNPAATVQPTRTALSQLRIHIVGRNENIHSVIAKEKNRLICKKRVTPILASSPQMDIMSGPHPPILDNLPSFDTSKWMLLVTSVSDRIIIDQRLLASSSSSPILDLSPASILSLVVIAVTLGILANGWIARLLSGEQGLGSYLSDGSGYNKSAFRPILKKDMENRAVQSDPLPWLRLPQVDFVDVAGQERRRLVPLQNRGNSNDGPPQQQESDNDESSMIVIGQLELLRAEMQEQVHLGNTEEARRLRNELERLMKEAGVQFVADP